MVANSESYQLRELAASVASLRFGKYSDFVIRCSDNTVIRAHRAVVCPRSRVLSAAVDGKFSEAVSNEIYLPDEEPEIVEKMVDFLYTTEYDDNRAAGEWASKTKSDTNSGVHDPQDTQVADSGQPDPLPSKEIVTYAEEENPPEDPAVSILEYNPLSLTTNVKVYIIADKNGIEALKKLASMKYQQVIPKCWNSPDFAESARLVYENTVESDRDNRDVIVQTASDNIKALLDRGEFIELLNSHGELATEILKKIVASDKPTNAFHSSFAAPSQWEWGSPTYGGVKKKKGRY